MAEAVLDGVEVHASGGEPASNSPPEVMQPEAVTLRGGPDFLPSTVDVDEVPPLPPAREEIGIVLLIRQRSQDRQGHIGERYGLVAVALALGVRNDNLPLCGLKVRLAVMPLPQIGRAQ